MASEESAMFSPELDMNIPELQKDLQRKYRNVGRKVRELWRDFTPKQRAKAMRETVGDGRVLKSSRDPGLNGLRFVLPDWNLEDFTSNPDFFLQRLEFRAETELQRQIYEGVNGGPGDREVTKLQSQRRAPARPNEWAVFADTGKDYGQYVTPNGAEGRRSLKDMAARSGLVIPGNEAEPLLLRQLTTFIHYNHLIEEILDLGSETRVTKTAAKKSKDKSADTTAGAMANLKIDPKPLKVSMSECQVNALGDLAIIISFMHTISSSIAMVPSSRKSGLYFTARSAELDTELNEHKVKADLGDHLIPMDNLLEPGTAANAIQALDEFMIEQAGASFGPLYGDMLQECLDDVEQEYAKAKARIEKDDKRTTYVPLPKEAPQTIDLNVQQRREKQKTRPAEGRAYDITPIAPVEPDRTVELPPRLKVKASTAAVFSNIFSKAEARGSVSWMDFAVAMADLDFSVTPKGGSIYEFNPPESMELRSITLHRPHASEIEGYKLLTFARSLNRKYRWDADTFEAI